MESTPEQMPAVAETIKDTDSPEKNEGMGFGIEIKKDSENKETANKIQELESAIAHDAPVTIEQILEVEKSLDSTRIIIGGEEMTVEEIRKIPNLDTNIKIWGEIRDGDLSRSRELTFLIPEVAEHLSHHQGHLYLFGLKSISDLTAEHLSRHQGDLDLNGLTVLSDSAAEALSKHQGYLSFYNLTALSDSAAESLSRHQYNLYLSSLTTLSDSAAEALSRKRGYLLLPSGLLEKVNSFKKHDS